VAKLGGSRDAVSYAEVLIRSACKTLLASPDTVSATTVSMGIGGTQVGADEVRKLALRLAEEHDLAADVSVHLDHMRVRLTRYTASERERP